MSDFHQGGGGRNKKFGGVRFGGGGFKKFGGDRGGRGGFGGKREGGFGGGFQKREVTMHEATCGECGNACEVPFKPSNDKPVFCNDCFMSKRNERDAGHRNESRQHQEQGYGVPKGTKERYISTPRENREPREVKSFDNSKNEQAIAELRTMVSEMGKKIESLATLVEYSSSKNESKPAKVVKEKGEKVVAKKAAAKKVAKKK